MLQGHMCLRVAISCKIVEDLDTKLTYISDRVDCDRVALLLLKLDFTTVVL